MVQERITTVRLVLRCWLPDDAPALRTAIDPSLPQLREWLPWTQAEPTPVEDLAKRLAAFRERFLAGEDWTFGLFDAATGTVLGGAGLHTRIAPDALEIGDWLCTGATGRGLASEAVEALTRAALEHGVRRVEIRCDPRNVRSVAVALRARATPALRMHQRCSSFQDR